jgi:hypothetical protein
MRLISEQLLPLLRDVVSLHGRVHRRDHGLSLSLFYVFIYLTRLGELELDARAHSGDMAAICTRTARLSAV